MNKLQIAFTTLFPGALEEDWLPSESLFNEALSISISDTDRILENAQWAGLPKDWEADISHAAEIIRSTENLSAVYSLAAHLLINAEERYDAKQFRYWPDPHGALGTAAPLFYLLLSLECLNPLRELHRKKGIPEDITRDTCSGIGAKAHDYFFFHERPGTMKWALWWFQHHLAGRLYRLGRLEFMLKRLYEGLGVFRRGEETRLICKDPESGKLITLLSSGDTQHLHGWETVLGSGDLVLDIHIPGGGGLTPDRIDDSLSRALDFFDRIHPDEPIKGFECISWIFSPDLEAAYSPQSNLIRFRDRVYLFPVEGQKVEGLPFIFGTFSENPDDWPEKTTVQRMLKQHIISGGQFRLSGMVYPVLILSPL